MELTRRQLLKLLGATGGGLATGVLGADALFVIPDHVILPALEGPLLESFKNSVCSQCPAGCGIRVRMIDGLPVRVMGNPLSPINKGGVCPMAEAGVEALYHPKRLRGPLKRAGQRGQGDWQEIGWDEALTILSDRLRVLRGRGAAEQLSWISRDDGELVVELTSRFMQAYGSPHHYVAGRMPLYRAPLEAAQGPNLFPVFDLGRTDFVLNFGADLLDEPLSPVRLNQIYAELRSRKPPARVVHFSAYLSRTASKSSEWVPVAPEDFEAVALGIAHVLIKDGSYDRAFVEKYGAGFADGSGQKGSSTAAFKSRVLAGYYPERVAQMTGVAAGRIVEIARQFARASTGLALAGEQAGLTANGFRTARAIHCLNALKGNLGKEGGVLFVRTRDDHAPAASPSTAAASKSGTRTISRRRQGTRVAFFEEIARELQARRKEVDTLVFCEVDPLFESAAAGQFEEVMEQVPFVVGYGSFMTETLARADLVLPSPVFLEKWEGIRGLWGVEFDSFGLQQPVVKPLYQTTHPGDLLLQLSARMGLQGEFPWSDYPSFVKDWAKSIFDSGRGAVISESVQRSFVEFMKERGWRPVSYATFSEFWELLAEKGGWWDPLPAFLSAPREILPGSGRFQFPLPADLVKDGGSKQASPAGRGRIESASAEPEATEAARSGSGASRGVAGEFPLRFLVYQQLANSGGRGAPLPLLQELGGLHSRRYWRSWVEMNPATAAELGLAEDQAVEVVSAAGRLGTRVKIVAGIMPGVVAMPFGAGYRFEEGSTPTVAVNPHRLLVNRQEKAGEFPALFSTRVRIQKRAGRSQA